MAAAGSRAVSTEACSPQAAGVTGQATGHLHRAEHSLGPGHVSDGHPWGRGSSGTRRPTVPERLFGLCFYCTSEFSQKQALPQKQRFLGTRTPKQQTQSTEQGPSKPLLPSCRSSQLGCLRWFPLEKKEPTHLLRALKTRFPIFQVRNLSFREGHAWAVEPHSEAEAQVSSRLPTRAGGARVTFAG